MGSRKVPFTRELYIDRADFRESANKKYKRMVTGGEVRLRNAYVIRCDEVVKDASGAIIELLCSYDDQTLGRNPEGRKVRGVIHWVSASQSVGARVNIYDRLFKEANPAASADFLETLNPDSLTELRDCRLEMSLTQAQPGDCYQFEREGYFCADKSSSSETGLTFNRVVSLRDSWAKLDL